MNFQSLTLTECASVFGVKTDTLKKWHGHGCPGEKDGSVWKFDSAKVFAWKLDRTREEYTPKPTTNQIPADGFEEIDPDYERARKDKEMADKLALGNMRTRGETVDIAAVKKLGETVMVALRQRILAMGLAPDEEDKCLIELMNLQDLDWSRDS